jgi:hypothetical protein
MGTDSGASAARIYDITFTLSDAEIKFLARLSHVKQLQVARLGNYIWWIIITAGVVLSFSGGAVALRYYGVKSDSSASTLVMALFSFFLAGSYLYRWLIQVWFSRVYAHRTLRRKETVRVRLSEDRITYFGQGREIQTTWGFIQDASIFADAIVLLLDLDSVLMIPLRAVSPPQDRPAFVEAVRSWMKSEARKKAHP